MDEMSAFDSLLSDLDPIEGKEVCDKCGQPLDEGKLDPEKEKTPGGDMKGVAIEIKPIGGDAAPKPELASDEPDEDMPLML